MIITEVLNRIIEQISSEDYDFLVNILEDSKNKISKLEEALGRWEADYDTLEYDYEQECNNTNKLEERIEKLESQTELNDLVDEILKEHLLQYKSRKYDTYDKIIEALQYARKNPWI